MKHVIHIAGDCNHCDIHPYVDVRYSAIGHGGERFIDCGAANEEGLSTVISGDPINFHICDIQFASESYLKVYKKYAWTRCGIKSNVPIIIKSDNGWLRSVWVFLLGFVNIKPDKGK